MRVWDGVCTMVDCTHVATSGTSTAVDKALDGRLWWGMAGWLKGYCTPAGKLLSEQPDVWTIDFYDAPYEVTPPPPLHV